MNPWDIDLAIASKQKQDILNMLNRQGPYGGSGFDGMRQQYMNKMMGWDDGGSQIEQLKYMREKDEKDRLAKLKMMEIDHYMKEPNNYWHGQRMGKIGSLGMAPIGPTRGHF